MSNTFLISLLICMILLPIGIYFMQRYNMNYYKIHGRDQLEILVWIKCQKWYNKFVTNIKNEIIESYRDDNGAVNLTPEIMHEIENKTHEIICGKYDKETISNAFCWSTSLEGTKYWGKVEYQFLKWYFGQYVDFHLFK